jgi:hypothetical protein
MLTECNADLFGFSRVEGRSVVAAFDGGAVSSEAGALLLGATDRALGLIDRFAACFEDARAPGQVVHEVGSMVGQRVVGIALGYEDVNDHDELRHDPVMALLSGRLEARHPRRAPGRYHKIGHDPAAIEDLFVDLFLEAQGRAPKRIVLDLDATDDPIHGDQEGRFFHGYYDCYLPLYIFRGCAFCCGRTRASRARISWPGVRPRGSTISSAWPGTRGWWRGSAATWSRPRPGARPPASRPGPSPTFSGPPWTSWSRRRRVVAKAQWTGRANPRFVVTSLSAREVGARRFYEELYCQRGEMENRIKECQLDLLADRTSAATLRANQLRLWFASMAYVLICALLRIGLAHTQFAAATCATVRLKLLKIGAQVRLSVRRIKIAMASGCPWQAEWALAHARLSAAAA